MIPEGNYSARATEAEYGRAASGTEQIGVSFVIASSPNAQYDGASLTWYGFFTPKTEERTLEALINCGCTNLKTLEGITKNQVQIVIEHENHYQTGVPHARVKWINKLGGVAMSNRMSAFEIETLVSRLQGKFEALKQNLGVASSPNASKPASHSPLAPPLGASVDDNIPF